MNACISHAVLHACRAFSLCDVEPCIAMWFSLVGHISQKFSNLFICIAKGGRIKVA